MFEAAYVAAHRAGKLAEKVETALEMLRDCTVCPRNCHVNRLEGELGFCETGRHAMISSANPHFGEETPLVGRNGSGTIFFTSCNLKCIFCQNYEISHLMEGRTVEPEDLAAVMLKLQSIGCHNINFVTPSHVVPQILEALLHAVEKGLKVPLVYNSGGYDSVETLRVLDGAVDIYMPDFKFVDPDISRMLMDAEDYPERAKEALKEMHRQVGDLQTDDDGIALRGLLVRHLVMPDDLAQTRLSMRFIAEHVSKNTYVNVMSQYRPCGRAFEDERLARALTTEEYVRAVEEAKDEGITRLDERAPIRFRIF